MKLVTIFTFVALIAITISSQGQERVTKTEELVKDMEARLAAALLQGDPAAVDALVAEDYIEIDAQGQVRRKSDLMAAVRARGSAPRSETIGPEVTIDETNLRTYGDTAVLVGRTTTRYQFMEYQTLPAPTQSPVPVDIIQERFMKVYSKRDGRWQLVASTRTAVAKR